MRWHLAASSTLAHEHHSTGGTVNPETTIDRETAVNVVGLPTSVAALLDSTNPGWD